MDISDDAFLMVLNNLTFKEYLKFRTTHKRVKQFDKYVECTTNVINCNGLNKERIIKMLEKYPKVKFSIKIIEDICDEEDNFYFSNFLNDISVLKNVYCLDLSETQVVDVSMLGNVHELNLSETEVIDVSALGNVHSLNLSYTNVENISMLGNVHSLNLKCINIFDVSALGNVHDLKLFCCNNIIDVSALGKVHTLNLSHFCETKKI
jgi:hypothetical protein